MTTMHKVGDLVFAKVEGWSPWPAKIMCQVTSKLYKVFFYGTRQESLVKFEWIWSSHDNMDRFSKRYGGKKDYCRALEQMKKKPEIFTVHDSDLCSHKCITCDQMRTNNEVKALVKPNPEISEATNIGRFYHSLNDSALTSMKNVKVVINKMKSVSDQDPKHETVMTDLDTSNDSHTSSSKMTAALLTVVAANSKQPNDDGKIPPLGPSSNANFVDQNNDFDNDDFDLADDLALSGSSADEDCIAIPYYQT